MSHSVDASSTAYSDVSDANWARNVYFSYARNCVPGGMSGKRQREWLLR